MLHTSPMLIEILVSERRQRLRRQWTRPPTHVGRRIRRR